MSLLVIQGLIDRRILVNYSIDPAIVQPLLPAPFRPHLYAGRAIAGICLIRFRHLRPKGFPAFTGLSSENGAHRFAVEWTAGGKLHTGVYIPRRDSASWFNTFAGGRLFPGKHYHAQFRVNEVNDRYQVAFTSSDKAEVAIDATRSSELKNSVFGNIDNASVFFKNGAVGYSPNGAVLEGLHLNTIQWKIEPMEVHSVHSSFFENQDLFPRNSITFDNALLMTAIDHEWYSLPRLRQEEPLIASS